MGKKGAGDFADRGLRRTLVDNSDSKMGEDIVQEVLAESPLRLGAQAKANFQEVSEIYQLRGFRSCELAELTHVDASLWALSWIDWGPSHWHSASFCVETSCGPWRVVVTKRGEVSSVFPVVDPDRGAGAVSAFRREDGSSGPNKSRADAGRKAERKRLLGLSRALKDCLAQLEAFLASGCRSNRAEVSDTCSWLQELCWEDLPKVSKDLEWKTSEGWRQWAHRACESLRSCCGMQELVLSVEEVGFTHDSISTAFRQGSAAGKDVECLVEDLRWGRVDPLQDQDLLIEAVCHKGRVLSLNNRRLWALKQHKILHAASEVRVRVRVLPWSDSTVTRFLQAFTSQGEGDTVACRTALEGAPPEAVVATTLGRAVMATQASKLAERQGYRKKDTPGVAQTSPVEAAPLGPGPSELHLGGKTFPSWREAKEHLQLILRANSGGRPLPEADYFVVLDVLQFHPDPQAKRLKEVTKITVGSSEKFAKTPCFWIWRQDGSGEDISVKKCWDKLDLIEKSVAKKDKQRDVLAGGQRFAGVLDSWVIGPKGMNFGWLRLDSVQEKQVPTAADGQKLYLEWSDVAAWSQAHVNANRANKEQPPFKRGQRFSCVLYQWRENGKVGCRSAELLQPYLQ
ncbi:unnamed protein product [Symbiodinium sp. CCMP2456]|nr:unnamed protein product [Symbiodinium sp. CCMP2456]